MLVRYEKTGENRDSLAPLLRLEKRLTNVYHDPMMMMIRGENKEEKKREKHGYIIYYWHLLKVGVETSNVMKGTDLRGDTKTVVATFSEMSK